MCYFFFQIPKDTALFQNLLHKKFNKNSGIIHANLQKFKNLKIMKKYYIIYYKCLIRRSIVLLHIYKSKNSCSLRALETYDLYKNK